MKIKEKILLAGKSLNINEDCKFKTYIPSRFGGRFTVRTTKGIIINFKKPNGTNYENSSEIGEDNHGWYTFEVVESKVYTISCTFIQEAEVEKSKKPWNGWYWPWSSSLRPSLCEKDGVLDKYDQFIDEVGTKKSAKSFEIKQRWNKERGNWEGYCPQWASASHLEKEPKGGDCFTKQEEKGLLTFLYFKKNTPIADYRKIRGVEYSAGEFHHMLEKWIMKKGFCIEGDLNYEDTTIWEYPVFYYYSEFKGVSKKDFFKFNVKTFLKSARDLSIKSKPNKPLPPGDNEEAHFHPDDENRDERYIYDINYIDEGTLVIENNIYEWLVHPNNKWHKNSKVPNYLAHCIGLGEGKCRNPFFDCSVVRNEILKNFGRIHLKNVGVGSKIYLNNNKINRKNIIIKGNDRIIKNLTPGVYNVTIKKSRYLSWKKKIKVIGQKRIKIMVKLEKRNVII